MGEKQSYRDLVVWQRAIDLTPAVYLAIRTFPNYETYALTDQIRRAVVSIPANIAEGQGRPHRKEFLQHLNIAKGSLAELHTLLILAHKLDYLTPNQLLILEDQLGEVARPLNGLIGHLGRGTRPSPTTDNRQPTTVEALP